MNYQATKRHGENVCTLLSERNKSEKATHCTIPTVWYSSLAETRDSKVNGY